MASSGLDGRGLLCQSSRWVRVTDVAKRRRQGLVVCRAALPSEGLDLCAPRCRARTRLRWSGGFPVGDEAPVGEFGLGGELALALAVLLLVVAALVLKVPATWVPLGACAEFEFAELMARERGARERVVLLAGEHVPEQHGQL